jgi:hypothetical protein
MSKTIAVLDQKRRLVGYKRQVKVGPLDVVVPDNCDLPANGTYKWDGKRFVPLGHGFAPVVTRPPATIDEVMLEIIEGQGRKAGPKATAWADWYRVNLLKREEEMSLRHRTPKITRD